MDPFLLKHWLLLIQWNSRWWRSKLQLSKFCTKLFKRLRKTAWKLHGIPLCTAVSEDKGKFRKLNNWFHPQNDHTVYASGFCVRGTGLCNRVSVASPKSKIFRSVLCSIDLKDEMGSVMFRYWWPPEFTISITFWWVLWYWFGQTLGNMFTYPSWKFLFCSVI